MNKYLSALLLACALACGGEAGAQTYPALDKIFADKACTVLSPTYAGMDLDAIRATDDYRSLPTVLQTMVEKVATGNWAETGKNIAGQTVEWDSDHARKYRVQMVEPFSDAVLAASMMDSKYHTNLNNPTGLYTDDKTTLYIFVEGKVPAGAWLYFNEQPGSLDHFNMALYNDATSVRNSTGIQLKEGMNVLTTSNDNALSYFFYTVDTYDSKTGERINRLSSCPDLKIHVEGGRINGFFNVVGDELYTPDTKADYDYLLARAAHPDFALIGRSFINIFPLKGRFANANGALYKGLQELNTPSFDPLKIMERWEDVISLIQTTAGYKGKTGIAESKWAKYYEALDDDPESFADFFNNRLLNIIVYVQGMDNVAMWSDNWYNGVFPQGSEDAMSSLSDLWGISHEYGHTVQGPLKVVGSTEISNNLHANVVGYLMTNLTSRNAFISDLLERFNRRQPSFDAQNWTGTRMYFQLWLYYHLQGRNPQFYIRLQDILRKDRLTHSSATDYIKFVKAACQASGEDLTDFFEAYGMFIPLDNFSADGTKVNLTAAEIAQCKAEIKAMNLPVNRQIIFIDDRPGSKRESRQGYAKENAGEYGGLDDFLAGSKADGKYTYTTDGSRIEINGGQGGVGFIVYGTDGTLLSFANTRKFNLSSEAGNAVVMGQATVYSVDADGTLTEIPSTVDPSEAMRSSLQNLVNEARSILTLSSEEDNIVGYYYSADLQPIREITAEAEAALKGSDTDAIRTTYVSIAAELAALHANPYTIITPADGMRVSIVSVRDNSKALTASSPRPSTSKTDKNQKDQQWTLESAKWETGNENSFYLRGENGLYIQGTTMLSEPIKMGEGKIAYDYTRLDNGNTAFTQSAGRKYAININPNGGVVSWNAVANDDGSQFIMASLDPSQALDPSRLLAKESYDAQATLDQAGKVDVTSSPLALTDKSFDTNAKCHQGGDAFTSWNVLIDNNPSTYFHSNWEAGTSDDGLPHWISVDLGRDADEIVLTYTTRGSGNVCAPTEILVQGSTDGKEWTDVATLSKGLPTANNTAYTSPAISFPTPVSHVRFQILANSTNQQNAGFYYFVMSEMGIGLPEYNVTIEKTGTAVTEDMMLAAYHAIQRASAASADDAEEALAELRATRQALIEAMATPSGIEDVIVEPTAVVRGIYDLQGRRLTEPLAPGLYIIDGRKTLIR